MNLEIISGQGITASILKQLQKDGVVQEGKNLSGSVWSQIMNLVAQDEEAKKQYTGGSEFIEGKSTQAKASWKENFIIAVNQTLTFTQELWDKIVKLAKGEKIEDNSDIKKELVVEPQEDLISAPLLEEKNPEQLNLESAGTELPKQEEPVLSSTIKPSILQNPENDESKGDLSPQSIEKSPMGLEEPPTEIPEIEEENTPAPISEPKQEKISESKEIPVNPTQEEIRSNIDNLKPGESFAYQKVSRNAYGSESVPVSWLRHSDNTLTEASIKRVLIDNKTQYTTTKTKYKEDGKTKISSEEINFSRGKTVSKYDDEGNLTQRNIDILPEYWTDSVGTTTFFNDALNDETLGDYSLQEFKNKKGKVVLTIKNGKCYNKWGKEFPRNKLNSLLVLLKDKDKPTELIQTK